ncbi:1-acyl-sn-glycerol-3-phosphate acyltransferase [Spirochaetia bacterium]|nr:1-acyl-sn-glycerol-3-phosphate acyltransferase [Spirochaetia bacterium]
MFRTIVSFILVALAVICATPFGIFAFIFSVLGFKKSMLHLTYRVAQIWGKFLILVSGSKLTVTGRENIPLKGGLCFVSNHSGIFDIILALSYAGRPFGFIAKKELLLIPLLNIWISLLGGLFIDRKHPRKALKTIQKGVNRLKAGGGMLIFPEGHRSRDGKLLPFHPGSFKLAVHSKVPIVPVAISGSNEVFEKNRRIRSAVVKITFLPPIPTAGLSAEDRKQKLPDQVYAEIAKALESPV